MILKGDLLTKERIKIRSEQWRETSETTLDKLTPVKYF